MGRCIEKNILDYCLWNVFLFKMFKEYKIHDFSNLTAHCPTIFEHKINKKNNRQIQRILKWIIIDGVLKCVVWKGNQKIETLLIKQVIDSIICSAEILTVWYLRFDKVCRTARRKHNSNGYWTKNSNRVFGAKYRQTMVE